MSRAWLLVLAAAWFATDPTATQGQELAELSLQVRIGDEEHRPDYIFGQVADIAFGPDGEFYVLDFADATVKVYNKAGQHLRSFGGRGEGPGEMRSPNRILVSSQDVTIFDPAQRRVVVYSREGEHQETRRLAEVEGLFDVVVPLRHGFWLGAKTTLHHYPAMVQLSYESPRVIRREGPSARDRQRLVVGLIRAGQTTVDTVFTYDHGFILRFSRGVGTVPRFWGRGGDWTVSGDSLVAFVDAFQGNVKTYRVGQAGLELVWEEQLPITPEPLDERDWRELAETADPDISGATQLIGPRFRAQVGAPLFADDGALWVRRLEIDPVAGMSPSSSRYFVLGTDGRTSDTIRLPSGFVLKAIRGDLLLGQRRTEWGIDVVEVWRLTR